MPLSEKRNRYLRGLAHHLRPIYTVGQQGLRESALQATDVALTAHELLKVRVHAPDRAEYDSLVDQIANKTQAEVVQCIGHVAVYFRRNQNDPRVTLSSK